MTSVVGGKFGVFFLTIFINPRRATIKIQLGSDLNITGTGDSVNKTDSEQLAALSALHQLNALGKAGSHVFSRIVSD
jgi:hypothetical protein